MLSLKLFSKKKGCIHPELIKMVAQAGNVQDIADIPAEPRVFVTAMRPGVAHQGFQNFKQIYFRALLKVIRI